MKLTTLDAAIRATDRRLTVVKLDLEGAEHAALRGASEILRDDRPHLIIEIEESARFGRSVADVAGLLESYGYKFYQARAGRRPRGQSLPHRRSPGAEVGPERVRHDGPRSCPGQG
jgi:hypothetical protein